MYDLHELCIHQINANNTIQTMLSQNWMGKRSFPPRSAQTTAARRNELTSFGTLCVFHKYFNRPNEIRERTTANVCTTNKSAPGMRRPSVIAILRTLLTDSRLVLIIAPSAIPLHKDRRHSLFNALMWRVRARRWLLLLRVKLLKQTAKFISPPVHS